MCRGRHCGDNDSPGRRRAARPVEISVGFALSLAACTGTISETTPEAAIVLYPNGVDDTQALQQAIDQCVANPGRCDITLAQGVYNTAPLVLTGFEGRIRGAGLDQTVICARTDAVLHLSPAQSFAAVEPTAEEPWPALITVVDGSVELRELTVAVPAGTQTDGWWPVCAGGAGPIDQLGAAIWVTGHDQFEFVASQVGIRGALEPASEWQFSAGRSLMMGSWLYPADYQDECSPMLVPTANVLVDRSVLSTALIGIDMFGMVDSQVRVSHTVINGMAGMAMGITDVGGSIRINNNALSADQWGTIGFWVEDGPSVGLPEFGNSRVHIHDNNIEIGELAGAAVYYEEMTPTEDVYFDVRDNLVTAGAGTLAGVALLGAQDAIVHHNSLSGQPDYGIQVVSGTHLWLTRNDFSGLNPAEADIFLDHRTNACVVESSISDYIVNKGADNQLIYY